MASSILGAFEGVKTKKKNKDDIQYIYYKDIRCAPKNREEKKCLFKVQMVK